MSKETSPDTLTSPDMQARSVFPLWAKASLIGLAVAVAAQFWLIARLADGDEAKDGPEVRVGAQVAATGDAPSANPNQPAQRSAPHESLLDQNSEWLGNAYDPATWDPFHEMQRMRERMDSLFGEAFGRFARSDRFGDLSQLWMPYSPQIDLRETDDAYELAVDLPGIEESSLEIEVEGQTLRLSGQKEEESEIKDESGQVLRRERHAGRFKRSLILPGPVEGGKIDTRLENGVLRIVIPKARSGDAQGEDS